MQKLSPHSVYISAFSTFLVFSKLFFAFFGSFWTAAFWRFRVLVYGNPHPDKHSFLNFFLNVGGGPPTIASGPLSATFPTLAQTCSSAIGPHPNFPE